MRRILGLAGLVLVALIWPHTTSAQTSADAVEDSLIHLTARMDSLSAQLGQTREIIQQQQQMIDVLMQQQAARSTAGISRSAAAPQQASNHLNPNISLVSDFRGRMGRDFSSDVRAFTLQETEIGIQAPVDPFARADAFLSLSPEGIEVEEGYITFQALPLGLQAKVGKFRSKFGKFNQTHGPETIFSDRPLASEAFFGEEGLAGVGTSLSLLISNPWIYLNLDAEITALPEEAPVFSDVDPTSGEYIAGGRRQDLMYLTRLETYVDLNESSNLLFGGTYATGVHDAAGDLRTHLESGDMTFRWRPLRRAVYHSLLWRTEVMFGQLKQPDGGTVNRVGLFSYIDLQFKRRWHLGERYDYTQFSDVPGPDEQGILGLLTFTPSEFSLLTVQARGVRRADGSWHGVGMMKITFNIGPHGTHPF